MYNKQQDIIEINDEDNRNAETLSNLCRMKLIDSE